MSSFSSWTVYARLKKANGSRIILGQLMSSALVSLIISISWMSIGSPNSFGKDGLIDGLGSLSSLLAGFYVAGLVAIATFFRENSSLDDVIKNGSIVLNWGTDEEENFTRRQYVCSMFGFLVGLSFVLAISAVILRAASPSISITLDIYYLRLFHARYSTKDFIEFCTVFLWLFVFVWQIEVTMRGLYYLMDRIYDVRPQLGKPRDHKPPND